MVAGSASWRRPVGGRGEESSGRELDPPRISGRSEQGVGAGRLARLTVPPRSGPRVGFRWVVGPRPRSSGGLAVEGSVATLEWSAPGRRRRRRGRGEWATANWPTVPWLRRVPSACEIRSPRSAGPEPGWRARRLGRRFVGRLERPEPRTRLRDGPDTTRRPGTECPASGRRGRRWPWGRWERASCVPWIARRVETGRPTSELKVVEPRARRPTPRRGRWRIRRCQSNRFATERPSLVAASGSDPGSTVESRVVTSGARCLERFRREAVVSELELLSGQIV